MAFPRSLKELCTPSKIYFIISIVAVILMLIQNMSNDDVFEIGCYSCNVPSTLFIFVMKMIYILFWTWILNLMCKDGHSDIAWFLLLVPFFIALIIAAMMMM